MAGRKSNSEPWIYPHNVSNDPEGETDRHLLLDPEQDHRAILNRLAVESYQRHIDYADAWLAQNQAAQERDRDRAFAYRTRMQKNIKVILTGRPDRAPATLADLQRRYEASGNPVYLWRAIAQALQVIGPDALRPELPTWCLIPLRAVAQKLWSLGQPGMPAMEPKEIVAILGLTRQGYNPALMVLRQEEKETAAEWAAELHAAGLPMDRARAVANNFKSTDPDHLRRKLKPNAASTKRPRRPKG